MQFSPQTGHPGGKWTCRSLACPSFFQLLVCAQSLGPRHPVLRQAAEAVSKPGLKQNLHLMLDTSKQGPEQLPVSYTRLLLSLQLLSKPSCFLFLENTEALVSYILGGYLYAKYILTHLSHNGTSVTVLLLCYTMETCLSAYNRTNSISVMGPQAVM